MKTDTPPLIAEAAKRHAELRIGSQRFPRLRKLAIHFVFNTIFCVACGLIITFMMQVGGSLTVNLVFALAIGTIAWLLIDGGRLLLWGNDAPKKLPFLILIGVSIPTAKYLGDLLAGAVLGLPTANVAASPSRYQSNFLILTILAALLITWFFWNRSTVAHLRTQAEAEKARAAAIEKQALQAQLQLLQAQIEPHMLFNTLANLQGLIAVDAPRAQHMLDQLIQYLRATLSSSRAASTTLEQEFALMRAYLELMSIRMGPRLRYALLLPEPLRQVPMAPMLLQPLLENAIRHGLEPNLAGGRIDVTASANAGKLDISVSDTGLGFDPARASLPRTGSNAGTGVGLANVRERLQALHGERAALILEPKHPAGTIARITLPLSP